MIREVDLVSYLPPFMAEYKETNITLTAENPEFVLAWKAVDRALKNEFITTADEYGIGRFEEILGIIPPKQDTLEARRRRVLLRWSVKLPYTWRMLLENLGSLCGENAFKVSVPAMGEYEIDIKVSIDPDTEPLLHEVQQMLEGYLPTNLTFKVTGAVERKKEDKIFTGATKCHYIKITAAPEPTQYKIERCIQPGTGVGTLVYTKGTYEPEREDI